jgi:hypothetical protein
MKRRLFRFPDSNNCIDRSIDIRTSFTSSDFPLELIQIAVQLVKAYWGPMVGRFLANHRDPPHTSRQNLKCEGFPKPGFLFRFQKFGDLSRGMSARDTEGARAMNPFHVVDSREGKRLQTFYRTSFQKHGLRSAQSRESGLTESET